MILLKDVLIDIRKMIDEKRSLERFQRFDILKKIDKSIFQENSKLIYLVLRDVSQLKTEIDEYRNLIDIPRKIDKDEILKNKDGSILQKID